MFAAVENNPGNVPAFLIKLWTLVEDPTTDELIHWDSSGTSFHVYDQQRFSREILPLYFKHNNIASFIRQLNMYGFRKVTHIDQGGLKIEKDDLHFQHQYFQRGEQDMLQYIKRKVSAPSIRVPDHFVSSKTDEVSRALSEMRDVKSKQVAMDENLEYIKRENKLLWREVALLRQKHHKQQQIVNKLIQFLVSLVSSNRTGLSIPAIRRGPLAIDDVSRLTPTTLTSQVTGGMQGGNNVNNTQPIIVTAPSPGVGEDTTDDTSYTIESPKIGEILLSPSPNMNGPIIHELHEPPPQAILVPVSAMELAHHEAMLGRQNTAQPMYSSSQVSSGSPNKNNNRVVLVHPHPSQPSNQTELNFLMSPKIEAGPSLEDALTYGLNVPTSSGAVSNITFLDAQNQQKRKRKITNSGNTVMEQIPVKRMNSSPQTPIAHKRPVPDGQDATTLGNIILANSFLNSAGNGGVAASNNDASLAVASANPNTNKDVDEFKLSSDQLDLLSSDLDGLKGILQDQYKLDPAFLMELFESSNPWPYISEKDLEDLKLNRAREDAGTSDIDHGNIITGTELVEYNPKDELFPELMADNMIEDMDDID